MTVTVMNDDLMPKEPKVLRVSAKIPQPRLSMVLQYMFRDVRVRGRVKQRRVEDELELAVRERVEMHREANRRLPHHERLTTNPKRIRSWLSVQPNETEDEYKRRIASTRP